VVVPKHVLVAHAVLSPILPFDNLAFSPAAVFWYRWGTWVSAWLNRPHPRRTDCLEQCLYISGFIPPSHGVVLCAAPRLTAKGSPCLSSAPISLAGLHPGAPHLLTNRIVGSAALLLLGLIESATKVPARSSSTPDEDRGIVSTEANLGRPSKGDFESMARRRFQDPRPKRRGKWWTIQVRRDDFVVGRLERRKTRVRIAPASVPEREARKIAAEYLRPQNQGLKLIGSATNFTEYVDNTYKPLLMPLMAKTTQERTRGVIANYLVPEFGKLSLRDLSPLTLQRYFSGLAASPLASGSKDKIKDVLSSILGSAVQYGLLVKNPVEGIRLPPERRGKRKTKPHVTPEQFEQLLELVPEPYASMVFVAVWTGLRVSELIGLRWEDVGADSLTIDERCCRGDWDAPKSEASNATIGVEPCVIERIHRLKQLTVDVKAGLAVRHYKVVKSDRPEDLVFQSVKTGSPMRDNNILSRHIKPAARKLGLPWINWRCMRTSHATWMVEAGANPKDVQGQMRHSRISTTMDIYAQFVPESQRRALAKMSAMVEARKSKPIAPASTGSIAMPPQSRMVN
jgi:integrase